MTVTEEREASWYHRLHERMHANPVTSLATKVVVTCLGVAVILAGLVMLVAPGPGLVAIVVGLGILATEWHWAERAMHWMKAKVQTAASRARQLDPAVRRRRILLGTLAFVVVGGGLVAYVWFYDWPSFAVTGWNWVQDFSGAVPELPGM